MSHMASPTSPPVVPGPGGYTATATANTGRAQLDTFARLQLAAALLEYDHDSSGKLAEHSAIFAPYRDEAPPVDYSADRQTYDDNDDLELAWRTNGYNDTTSKRLSVAAGGAEPAVFTDFLGGSSANGIDAVVEVEEADGVRDADLASEWGLESVMTKFDNLDLSELKAKGGKTGKGRTRKKSRAQSDIYGLTLEEDGVAQPGNSAQSDSGAFTKTAFETQSLPDVLDYTQLPSRKKGPKESAGARARKASLSSELEMAFSSSEQVDFGDVEEDKDDAAVAGGRSRSSSMGGVAPSMFSMNALANLDDPEGMEEITASYAAEEVARPPSSMSGYVSRFDPKAIAAQQEEETSTRLRFPNSLHPKILIMPAPLAGFDEPEAKPASEAERKVEEEEPQPKPRIEREAGKLYGKSLMDELNERKIRQKAKQRAFQGDSRRAMTDNLNQRHLIPRAPSPLSGEMGEGEADEVGELSQLKNKKGQDLDDPWVKYTSHRSLAVLAGNKKDAKPEGETQSPSKRVTTLLSPGHSPHSYSPTSPGIPQSRSQAAHLSTAELQAAYKRSSSMPLLPPTPDSDSDDDVPLDTRRAQLSANANKPATKAVVPEEPKAMPSVFGQDIVMQRELEKLEKILKIEEAEKKIQAEKERIKEAEREEKDRKKREKTEKKAKKKMDKDKNTRRGQLEEEEQIRRQEEAHFESQQAEGERSRPVTSEEQRRTVLINHGLLPPEEGYEFQHDPYQGMAQEEEEDHAFWDPAAGRNSEMMPLPGDSEEDTRPQGRPRSNSLAPSLALSFVPTLGDTTSPAGDALSDAQNWFGASSSDSGSEVDDDEREERLQSKSRAGFGEDDENRIDPSEIWNTSLGSGKKQSEEVDRPGNERSGSFFDTARKPELKKVERADSFFGVLESFGIQGDDDSDDDGNKGRDKSRKSNRLSTYGEMNSESDEEEEAPLASVLANRRSQALLSSSLPAKTPAGKITLDPPRLDLPTDFSLAQSPKKMGGSEDDDSGSDYAPLHVKRLTTALNATSIQPPADREGSEVEEDDLPLALRQDDEVPLGQRHPMAAMSQQIEYQQQQNQLLVQQMQFQYQMQQQYQYEMQMQQMMAMQQAAMQGYPASAMGGYAPSQMGQMMVPVDMSGAASDIGLGVPPDPKLVNSVDRWRQNVQH